ncbi:hypothetical protein AGMMS49983_03460 [Clostridia bacterium]|nr:hypothetical protein AGMMS49983_03460 [Clostridia bacterium]
MKIIGREKEKQELQRYYESPRPEFVAVCGRRRVGKTYLIKEFFENRFAFYFTGVVGAANATQLANFDVVLQEYGSGDKARSEDWFVAFSKLKKLLSSKTENGRKVIFIDELPWLDAPRSGFLSAFGYFWNTWASANPDILLIVCGSATSWIEKKIFRDKGGLHNRVTGRIFLEPFSLGECEAFFRDRSVVMNRYQILETYMIFGGIPYYLNFFNKGLSLPQNVDSLCFVKSAPLKNEYDELYMSLFKNYERHMKIAEVLSKKKSGMTRDEITYASGIPAGGHLTAALTELLQCGFIDTYNDFTKKKNGAYYRLIDSFTLFYLRFMQDNNSKDEYFWTNYIEDGGHRAWSGFAFEQICMLHISQIKAKLGITGVSTQTVSWRSKNADPGAQIDLLIKRRDGVINLCEMKYTKHPYMIEKKEDENLHRRMAVFAGETKVNEALHLTMITTYGVSKNGYFGSVQAEVTMDDLFS